MKDARLSLKILFTIFLFHLLTGSIFAQNNSYEVGSLCEHAKVLYDFGETEEARREFNRVLIIDPENAMAKQYLQKMGLSKGAQKLKTLEKSLKAKEQELASLSQELELKEIELQRRTEKFKLQESKYNSQVNQLKETAEKLKALENSFQTKEQELAKLNEELRLTKIELQKPRSPTFRLRSIIPRPARNPLTSP
jgi:tetratricopeptide (TPR) repeat protein